jgi:hypothetical protein
VGKGEDEPAAVKEEPAQPFPGRRYDRNVANCGRGAGCRVDVEEVDVHEVALAAILGKW